MNFAFVSVFAIFLFSLSIATSEEQAYWQGHQKPRKISDFKKLEQQVKSVVPELKKATVSIDINGGSGSGVIVSADGLIMTAAHVALEVGKEVKVIFESGETLKAITLGLHSENDAAMAKIINESGREFPFVKIAEEEKHYLGDFILSIGHSGGFNESRGAVVRLGRVIEYFTDSIKTDGTLIGGDSGGPLFNLRGELIGIHSRVGQVLNENVHVPVSTFKTHWSELESSEFLGMGPFAEHPALSFGFIPIEKNEEIYVQQVLPKSLAQKGGLQSGDAITQINERVVTSFESLAKGLNLYEKSLQIKVKRNGKEILLKYENDK